MARAPPNVASDNAPDDDQPEEVFCSDSDEDEDPNAFVSDDKMMRRLLGVKKDSKPPKEIGVHISKGPIQVDDELCLSDEEAPWPEPGQKFSGFRDQHFHMKGDPPPEIKPEKWKPESWDDFPPGEEYPPMDFQDGIYERGGQMLPSEMPGAIEHKAIAAPMKGPMSVVKTPQTTYVGFLEKPSEVRRKILRGGTMHPCPDGSTVWVNVHRAELKSGKPLELIKKKFPFELKPFVLGNGHVCDMLECAVARMGRNEHAVVRCTNHLMCDEDPVLGIKLGTVEEKDMPLHIELEVLDHSRDNGFDIKWEEKEKIAFVAARKEVGAQLFKRKRFRLARERFRRASNVLTMGITAIHGIPGSFSWFGKEDARGQRRLLWLNASACSLQMDDMAGAIQYANEVLNEEPNNIKALYRRATAENNNQDYNDAINDLTRLLQNDEGNTEAKRLLKQVQAKQKKRNNEDRSKFQGILEG